MPGEEGASREDMAERLFDQAWDDQGFVALVLGLLGREGEGDEMAAGGSA